LNYPVLFVNIDWLHSASSDTLWPKSNVTEQTDVYCLECDIKFSALKTVLKVGIQITSSNYL